MNRQATLATDNSPPPGETLGDMAYDRIKESIIRCELEPGEPVTEARLAEKLGMGKAPIRQALSRLTQEGFVRAMPRKCYIVSPITLRDVHELFELRLLLEPAAARKAAGHIDPVRLRQLEKVCQAGYLPGDRRSESDFLAANKRFHLEIVERAANRKVTRVLSHVLDEMSRLFHLGLAFRDRTEEMRQEHRDLVEALAVNNGEAAERVTAAQIEASRRMVLDAIFESSKFQSVEIRMDPALSEQGLVVGK